MLTAAKLVEPTLVEFYATRAASRRGASTRCSRSQAREGGSRETYTTVLCRVMQVRSTSSIDLPHQSLENISISE
jgi:hypothetical protein